MPKSDLDAELAALPAMSRNALHQRWAELTGRPIPRVSAALLRLALAWEMQAAVYGSLSRRSEQRLARTASIAGGGADHKQKLVREWKGTLHTVTIDADDKVHWNGQQWKSLSEVARTITGTRWSGPAFFGLKRGSKAA